MTLDSSGLDLCWFKIYQTKSPKFWHALWTVFGAAVFGFATYASLTFLLNRALRLPAWTETASLFLTIPASRVIGAHLGYRFGKRRGFRPNSLLTFF